MKIKMNIKIYYLLVIVAFMTVFSACKREVGPHLQSISIEPISNSTVQPGNTLTLTPLFTPENAIDKTVRWESDKPNYATVDSNGVVTGVSYSGWDWITITVISRDGGYRATIDIRVR